MTPKRTHAAMRIHKPESADLSIPDFSQEEETLRKQEAAIEEQKRQLEAKRQEAEAAIRRDKKEKYDGLLEDARDWREMAREFNDPEKAKIYFAKAKAAEAEAIELGHELGLTGPAPVAIRVEGIEKPSWLERNQGSVALLQIGAVVLMMLVMFGLFQGLKIHIDTLNQSLPDEQRMQPYDLTSIQKFFFEKLVVITDLPSALIMVFLIAPWVGFYVLPFLRSKKDFHTEFYQELSPFQRVCISTTFIIGLLLCLALSHSVRP